MKFYNKNLKNLSRELRKNQTEAELILWRRIKNKQISNVIFYLQKSVHNYILDFYCHRAKLAIELEGGQHFTPNHKEKDKLRDQFLLQGYDIKTIRFTNCEIIQFIDDVVEKIYLEVAERQ